MREPFYGVFICHGLPSMSAILAFTVQGIEEDIKDRTRCRLRHGVPLWEKTQDEKGVGKLEGASVGPFLFAGRISN